MNTKIDSTHDLLPENFDDLAREKFKEYSKTKQEHLIQNEFYLFIDDFFKDEKEICEELKNQEFYNKNNKSNSSEGLNFQDFKEAFHDCYLRKYQKAEQDSEEEEESFGGLFG